MSSFTDEIESVSWYSDEIVVVIAYVMETSNQLLTHNLYASTEDGKLMKRVYGTQACNLIPITEITGATRKM